MMRVFLKKLLSEQDKNYGNVVSTNNNDKHSFVSNEKAKKRLLQLGEYSESVFVLGSPDLDLMNEKTLPDLKTVKNYYDITFTQTEHSQAPK